MDAFRGHFLREDTKNPDATFILSHYHGDHYTQLPRDNRYRGPAKIHCTPVTARLLTDVHLVSKDFVVEHEYGSTFRHRIVQHQEQKKETTNDDSSNYVNITFYDANHCPGACIIFIELPDGETAHLHTGDMRYHPRFDSYPLLSKFAKERKLDLVYLDTTYCNPKHDFLTQEEAVNSIASQTQELLSENSQSDRSQKTLVLLSCYSIGKEKVLYEASKRSDQLIYVSEKKWKMLRCIQEDRSKYENKNGEEQQHEEDHTNIIERCTREPSESDLHVVSMGLAGEMWPYFQPNFPNLAKYVEALSSHTEYDKVVAFIPTGWADASNWNKKNAISTKVVRLSPSRSLHVEVRLISYSEHSTFPELVSFVQYLKPRKIIPTVYSDASHKRQIEGRFRNMLDSTRAKQAFFRSMTKPKSTVVPIDEISPEEEDSVSSIIEENTNSKIPSDGSTTKEGKFALQIQLNDSKNILEGNDKSELRSHDDVNENAGDSDEITVLRVAQAKKSPFSSASLNSSSKNISTNSDKIDTIVSMGFGRNLAEAVLQKCNGNMQHAIHEILSEKTQTSGDGIPTNYQKQGILINAKPHHPTAVKKRKISEFFAQKKKTKNHQYDYFTGKEISTGPSNRRHRVSGQIRLDSDDDETDDSSFRQSGEISPSDSSNSSALKTTQDLQQKAPPPLINPETVKEIVLKIFQRIRLKDKKEKMSILEKALSQRKAYNQQLAPTRPFLPRIQAASTNLEYMERNESRSNSDNGDGHTAIVNSSLVVLSTINNDKVKENAEQTNVHEKANFLDMMPYQFKILQKQFTAILDELPFNQRYDPEVHAYVSQLLYTPSDNSKPRLEVPPEFEEAPANDVPPPEALPKLKDPDENNQDYVSVMENFRDFFCVQCKTFDCQFHIPSCPDAGIQACVAIQYDKRALKKQPGTQERLELNRDDPFSSLVPTTKYRMVLVKKRSSERFENPTSVDVIGSTKSTSKWIEKSTYTFSSDNMICPFCNFCCHGKEKISKHISRYHADTFYCEEVGTDSKITGTVRLGEKETFKPVREYFHSKSLIPIDSGHHDRDSDDESVYSWYHDYRRDLMEDLTDVCEKEKRIFIMWNRFLGYSPVVIADKDVPNRCFYFIQKHFTDLGHLEWELYQLLITFWERHLLTVIHVEKLMHLFHAKQETQYSKQEENPLPPCKMVLFSRLYMIFESLGEHIESRLRGALRRNDVGNNDVVCTPMLPKPLWPQKWTTNRTISMAMRMRTVDISRPFFFPCFHAGKCDKANGCTCLENGRLCTKHCVWGVFGDNFFPGCRCKGDCTTSKLCPCRDANRECDPDVCQCNASTDGCRKTRGCKNMDVSLARRVPLLVGRSIIEGARLGLFTKNALKQGDYVDEVRSNNDDYFCPFLCSF